MRMYLMLSALLWFLSISATVVADDGPANNRDTKDLKSKAKFAVQQFTYYSARNQEPNQRSGLIEFNKPPVVIRSAEELVANSAKADKAKDADVQKEMSLALAKLFKVDAIDWNKQR